MRTAREDHFSAGHRACGIVMLHLALAVFSAGCQGRSLPSPVRAQSDFVVMGTEGRIVVYAATENQCSESIAGARKRLEEIDDALSTYKPDSELSAVNRAAGGNPVPVSESTARAIQASKDAWKLTSGAYNPLVGPLVHLWRSSAGEGRLPAGADLAVRIELLDIDEVELSHLDGQHYCRLARSGMELDLGGLAKGWAADEAVAIMRQTTGVRAALVMLGGDGAGWSDPGWTRPWSFGVQDPRQPDTRDVLDRIEAGNLAVVTSGNYYRFFEIGGRRYSHIIDPRTGTPSETDVASATVVDTDGGRADALATACIVLGADGALELLERVPGAEGLILQNADGGLAWHRTSGYGRFEVLP